MQTKPRPAPEQLKGWERNWRAFLAAAFLLGLAIRLASVLARPHLAAGGDPLEYVGQANLLSDGKGWIEPLVYAHTGAHFQTAKLPPLFTLLMAVCSVVGLKSFFAHRIWSAILGSLAVPVAAGLGKEVAGRKVAVVAAFGIAVYPNMWMSDGLAMSETVSPILTMLALWAAYRMWRRPTRTAAALLGLSVGLAALARDELILLALLVLVPVAWLAKSTSRPERLRLAGIGVTGVVVVVAPWIGFNLSRFSHPVLISDRFGVTVAAANCDSMWHGPLRGYWSMECAARSAVGVHGDESAVDPVALRRGLHYVSGHLSGLPAIEAVRLGRTFGFYAPENQLQLDSFIEGRPLLWAQVGLGSFYGFAALSVAGAVVLRRRGVPIFPMAAVAVDVVVAVLLTYGQTRFRATLEPVLVLLSAVAVVEAVGEAQLLRRRWKRLRRILRARGFVRRVSAWRQTRALASIRMPLDPS
ncbi:MAG TPA: glycosyltransferase family 39 protein [Acidimicrobiales bacterium]